MKHAKNPSRTLATMLVLAALAACNGSSKVGDLGADGSRPELVSIDIGRVVDVYAYRRVDPNQGDRRLRTNRRIELVQRNVMVNAGIESQSLFDAAGEAVASASYEFLPFDKAVGHEELVILWDDSPGNPEEASFRSALTAAQQGLTPVPASYRGQNTFTRPIPIVPRNAAIRLKFSGPIEASQDFFAANPSAVQLLEFKGDPNVVQPTDAFRILPYRVIPAGDSIILDTTILGGESGQASSTPGLPVSSDNVTANIRLAIPSRGQVSSTFYVKSDPVPELNGVDSSGRQSVIRDFRSGNLADGAAGRLREPESPAIVASLAMGVVDVDTSNNVLTINKRNQFVPVRGRYPFVDGPLGANGVPAGPFASPVETALRHGDIITQVIQVEISPGVFEPVSLRAEVLENLDVVTEEGSPGVGLARDPVANGAQGEQRPTARVRVASVFAARDSNGTLQRFQANTLPLGQDCVLRAVYHEAVPFTGSSAEVTDRGWRNLFVRIEPKPAQPAIDVQPNASVAIEFTKPMDLDQVDPTANLLLTNTLVGVESFAQQMADPKRATTRVVPARLADLSGDGTVLRLQPQMGFFHVTGTNEGYAVHVRLGAGGVSDLAGNPLEVFDDPSSPIGAWSVDFRLAAGAAQNLASWHTYLFEAEDEDGSLPGSVDIFGQDPLENGRLIGASGVRFGRSADQQNLATISRINRGECWDGREVIPNPATPPVPPNIPNPNANTQRFPAAPVDQANIPHPGNLDRQPRMSDTVGPPNVPQVYEYWQQVPQPVGRVVEPLKPQGSRMQMRYIEDDFSLSYRQPSEFGLDVEQLYWSPFNDETVLYDVFDRFTMSLSHSRRRPDEFWFRNGGACILACPSMNSALSLVFADNVLEGTSQVPVFEDAVYRINPNEAFRTNENVKYVPFPRFDRTYTWRDSRLISVDGNGNVIGLGGAQQPGALPPFNDFTANIDSPWIVSNPLSVEPTGPAPDPEFFASGASIYVMDPADFVGNNQRDHDPIALPLLVDFKIFPDDAANGFANGNNGFQVAMLGPPTYGFPAYGGYYDQVGAGCGGVAPPWPRTRVHASGGFDLISGAPITIDPANQLSAQGNVVKDAGALAYPGGVAASALMPAPAGDGMMNWARADFVRKVSTMTFGFFDTLRPQRAQFANGTAVADEAGFPDLLSINGGGDLRIVDLVVQTDPPQARQPAGTSVVVEMRGADTFINSDRVYNPSFATTAPAPAASDAFDTRGNLLNANYSCEAYRYSTPNVAGAPRVVATGLTRYVTEDELALIRNPATQKLPRFMNMRVVMTNNVNVSPALSPSLRSMSIVYRVAPQ